MSSLYEKSIADAEELREVALKNAESLVLEKYSTQVRKTLKAILEEQPDTGRADDEDVVQGDDEGEGLLLGGPEAEMPPPPADMGAGLPMDMGMADEAEEDDDTVSELPDASVSGGDEEVTLTINVPDLEISDGKLSAEGEATLEINLGDLEEEVGGEVEEALGDEMVERDNLMPETIEINLDALEKLNENTESSEQGDIKNLLSEANENNKVLLKEVTQRDERIGLLTEELSNLKESNNKYENILYELKEQLDTLSVSSAKLLYSNRVLKDGSLNEKQKEQIVESITEARNMHEAKVIYDTLTKAVGPGVSKAPKSLSEVVENRSSKRLLVKESKRVTPQVQRMQRLAGITKK